MWILFAFGASTVIAAIMAISVLLWSAMRTGVTDTKETYLSKPRDFGDDETPRPRSRVLPYAVPVALGTWLVLCWLLMRGQL
jgi:hypothetical protein